jgi:Flp pilus assembly pilin Flp
MVRFYLRVRGFLVERLTSVLSLVASLNRQEGQTTAEYALVILAAAAVAVVLITWAKTSGKLPAFFDQIIDDVAGNA